jgi:hypothetical protein
MIVHLVARIRDFAHYDIWHFEIRFLISTHSRNRSSSYILNLFRYLVSFILCCLIHVLFFTRSRIFPDQIFQFDELFKVMYGAVACLLIVVLYLVSDLIFLLLGNGCPMNELSLKVNYKLNLDFWSIIYKLTVCRSTAHSLHQIPASESFHQISSSESPPQDSNLKIGQWFGHAHPNSMVTLNLLIRNSRPKMQKTTISWPHKTEKYSPISLFWTGEPG